MKKKIQKIFKFILVVFGPLLGGFTISQLFSVQSYKTINKPPLSPNKLVFPIAWSILYLLMGISLYIILREKYNIKSIMLFIIQLILNYIWSFIFFEFNLYILAVLWILLILYFVTLMIAQFYSIKKTAAYLQIPYYFWLLFALYLNIGVALLN